MLLRVDAASEAPLYEQIAGAVRAEVADGRAGPGDRLPSARDVAESLGVNLHTVLKAYQLLRDEGLVDLRRGRGAVITDAATPLAELHRDIEALRRKAKDLGVPPATLVALMRGAFEA